MTEIRGLALEQEALLGLQFDSRVAYPAQHDIEVVEHFVHRRPIHDDVIEVSQGYFMF